MRVHLVVAEVDGLGLDGDVHGAGLGFLVVDHLARAGVELAAPHRLAAHVVCLEGRVRVQGVDVVGGRRGERDARGEAADRQSDKCMLHGQFLCFLTVRVRGKVRRWTGNIT